VGEVGMLRAGIDVDLEAGVVFVQAREGWKPKYGKDRAVPISSVLEPYLIAHLQRRGPDGGYLFPGRDEGSATGRSNLFLTFRRVLDDAELSRDRKSPDAVSFHTLRHTFASWLVMAGADLFTVARLMGHTTTKQIEETYGHLSPGHRLATVEMLSTKWANRPTSTAADRADLDQDTTGDTQNA
jgi:integrase